MLASTVRALAHRVGFELTRYVPRNFAHLRRVELLRSGRFTLLLDVGADTGDWAAQARACGFGGRIESFEPRSSAYARLERAAAGDPAWLAHQVALSDRTGRASMNVSPTGQASSLHELGLQGELEPTHAYIGAEEVELALLDNVAAVAPNDVVYLKVDVQGHELAVLEGATATLERCAAVELELSFQPLYAGQALAPELFACMDARGFRAAAFEPSWRDRRSGDLLLANAIFLPIN
jgi:FkbM family methyltransferase